MKGWLRSWKLCEVCPEEMDGIPGWRKRQIRRATFFIPPGNVVLWGMNAGCRMVGSGWARHEITTFQRAHPDVAVPRFIDKRTVWLPHLPGVELAGVPANEVRQATLLAFAELGRFHRLDDQSIHSDPHAGNFLYDQDGGRCRILDFETTLPTGMDPAQGRARDFAILALDLWRRGGGSSGDFETWRDAYGMDEGFCPVRWLFCRPGLLLRCYWQLLGYRWPSIS